MELRDLYKQMMDFNKRIVDNSFSAMLLWQDQTESVVNTVMEQATWMPEDSKKAFESWTKTYKQTLEDFHQAVSEGFKKADEAYSEFNPEEAMGQSESGRRSKSRSKSE
jgi:hypothetical protein